MDLALSVSDFAAAETQDGYGRTAARDGALVFALVEAWRAGEDFTTRGHGAAFYRVCWRRRWRAKL
eukprot:7820057-Lingulodinium_polyedra.AAC.1